MWTGLRTAAGFCKADFQESSQILDNPGRGWYHIYPFAAKPSPVPPEEEVYLAGGEERLALARIDIGAYRSRQLSDRALARIDSILDFFQANGKQVILRIAYDTSGKGLEREPETLDLVERHMEQVGDVLRPRGGGILVIQGIFVGNWGEMHGSRFLTDRSMARLLEAMYRSAGGCCPVAVRTPAQWRRARALADPGVRLALFNDGIFGSQTDLGTYGTSSRREAGEGAGWTREEELSWQAVHLECLPNGGEALAGPSPVGYRQAAAELGQMHLSYLNSAYQPKQLDHWRGEAVTEPGCWAGASGFDYIGAHLGYRFVIRDARALPGRRLRVTIENCGFAGLCEEADCFLETEGAGPGVLTRLEADPRNWRSGERTRLEFPLPREASGGCRLFLQLRRRWDGQPIRFANQEAGERAPLGALKN